MLSEISAFCASCLMVILYYLYLIYRMRISLDASVHTFNASIRRQWLDMVMNGSNLEILAVQTLRNSMIAANFMASTAVLLIIGALNLSEKIGQWALEKHELLQGLPASSQFWQFKLGCLILDFFIAFFCFTMAIRFFSHVGYMINLPHDANKNADLLNRSFAYLNKAGRYYTFGNRAFYFSLPIVMWFFGPYSLLLGTVFLVAGLAILDKTPR